MKISIVTPVYNDPRIRNCLESVNNQEIEFEVEHIVVDGQSTDETVEIIDEYEKEIDQIIREPDNGLYDAMNKGIAAATGDIIGILNADDQYQDENVLKDVSSVMNDESVDACYGDLVYVNDKDKVIRYWQSGLYHRAKFYFGWMPPHPTLFVRAEVYDKHGLFDLSFSVGADYELMLRLLLQNQISVEYLDRILVRMAIGGVSNGSVPGMLRAVGDMYAAWKKYNLLGRYCAPFLHPIEKSPQYIKKPPSDGE